MDLGIKGKTAIVCAASKGLGKGCAMALAKEGVDVVISARGAEALNATAEEIRKATGVKVTAIACDVTTEEGRKQILAACPSPDILINNAGGPPPGDFKDFSLDDWRKAVEWNMITPLALIKSTVYGMMDRGFGRIVNITSQSVKAPIASLELSNGAQGRTDRRRRRHCAQGRHAQRHHQRAAAGALRYRSLAGQHQAHGRAAGRFGGRRHEAAPGRGAGRPFRHA